MAIVKFARYWNPDVDITADLPTDSYEAKVTTVPDDIYPTATRPDLVLVNRNNRTILLVELTVPFDGNQKTHQVPKGARPTPGGP